jgi:hypothetical protein
MDIHIVTGSCGMVGDVKTWIVDAWETQSDADARVEQLVELENKFWGDPERLQGLSSYDLFNYGKIVEKEMRVAENGDPGYIHDAFTAVGYVTQKSKLKKWREPENELDGID